ncbi:pre-mRNA-splicing factor CWC22 homolog [Cephus cinctus]|uniref:Pre-mRNA-splicing factor CWC22 homolog n=1 Tax=Cephus cinctus TaxID=211228 RepID=A0AAJ7BRK9_CEPCN|nr:pre-mRNA-splicing factor CWC22 homolog [Cephus cinctus]
MSSQSNGEHDRIKRRRDDKYVDANRGGNWRAKEKKNADDYYCQEGHEAKYKQRRRQDSRENDMSLKRSMKRVDNKKYNNDSFSSKGAMRKNEQVTGQRYWDNAHRTNDNRYGTNYDTDEEIMIGERFYGNKSHRSSRSIQKISRYQETSNVKKIPADGLTDNRIDEDTKNKLTDMTPCQKRTVDLLTSKTGGAYIPPAKLRMMQAEITDKSGAAYQRIAWEALKKSIHGYINKVNTSNIRLITRELLRENIVRGRGLLARSVIQAQAASPTFTSIYAALVAVINSKFPNIGELLLKRLVIQFKRGFRRNDKPLCISSGTFIAHLVNQRVAHEILALEILTLLVETPTDDSIEVAIAFLKECGMKLTEVSRKGIEAIFEMLRNILHEGQLDKRVQYMIEVIFQIRKDGFKDHEAVSEELDLVEEEHQFTHLVTLDEATDAQNILNVFKFDTEYVANEDKYKDLSKEILDTDSSGSDTADDDDGDESSDEDSGTALGDGKGDVIVDNTETNLTALRRTIYLTIHSSLDFEECAHKLMKMQLKPGQEIELCHMFLDCCAEMRTYEKFFGLLAGVCLY